MAGGSKPGGSKAGSEKKRKYVEEEVEVMSGESSSRTQSAEEVAPPHKKKTKKDPPPTPIQKKAEGSESKKKEEEAAKKKVSKGDKGKEKVTEETEKNLEKALQLYNPKRFDTNNHPPKLEIVKLAKEEFFLPNASTTSKQLTHSVLKVEAKILFTILVRCVVPKEYSRELITERILTLMYLVMHGYEVDMPKIVMEHMLFCSTDKRKHPLPYANLLTSFFKYHQIPDNNEEVINEGVGILNEKSLEKIGVVKTSSKVWKLYSDLTEGELKTKKFLKPKSLTSTSSQSSQPQDLSSIMQKLLELESDLTELKENQHSFGMDFVQMKYMLETVFKSTTLFHVEEEVSQAAEGSKKKGSTKDLFSDHTTPEEDIGDQDKGKKVVEAEGEAESPDSCMLIKDLKKKKKKKKKEKIPEIVTEKDLFEETAPEGTEENAEQATEGGEEESEEEAADQTGEPTP